MQTSKLLIVGAGGHGLVVAESAVASGHFQEVLFADDWVTTAKLGLRVLEGIEPTQDRAETYSVIIAMGDNLVRRNLFVSWKSQDASFVSVIHPTSVVSASANIGEGCMLLPNVTINAQARIGDNSIINTGCVVEHNCDVGDSVHIAPNSTLAGCVTVGDGTLVGAGTTILPGITVGRNCVVGAGSVVTKPVEDNEVVLGNPARLFKKL